MKFIDGPEGIYYQAENDLLILLTKKKNMLLIWERDGGVEDRTTYLLEQYDCLPGRVAVVDNPNLVFICKF